MIVDKIECQEIVLKNKKGDSLVLKATGEGVGLWLTCKKNSRYLTLSLFNDLPYISLSKDEKGLPTLAISVSDDNEIVIQTSTDGKEVDIMEIDLEDK